MTTSRLALQQRQACYYYSQFEAAVPTPFPIEIVRALLSSDHVDDWTIGLYLVSSLERNMAREYYFEDERTHSALSKFIATQEFDSVIRKQEGDRILRDDQVFGRIADWGAPRGLEQRVRSELITMSKLSIQRSEQTTERAVDGQDKMAVIIHGTFAAKESWWQPNIGPFWNYIKGKWPHLYSGTAPFWWSGANNHSARVAAGYDLIRWAESRGIKELDIIAHSHGGNVALSAAQYGLRINKLILLGTPIRTEFMLTLKNKAELSNIFSITDWTQYGGAKPHTRGEGRTLSDSSKVTNWRAEHDGSGGSPNHSELHEPATWQASDLDQFL